MSEQQNEDRPRVITMDEDLNAKTDAFQDIQEEYEGDEAYFGSALVRNVHTQQQLLLNKVVRYANSYEEAVGTAYLDLQEEFPPDEGWKILGLNIDEETILVRPEPEDEDEDDEVALDA